MRRKVVGSQNVSRNCMICGVENAMSPKAHFLELDSGELLGVFEAHGEHQGYPGRLHGGMAAAMLDETMGRAINVTDPTAWGVTLELSTRYRKPVPLDAEIHAIGRITQDSGRIFEGSGEIVLADGTVAVEATGKYLRMPIEKIASADFDENDWFADSRPLPEEIDL